jgi:3-deoxy-manno-octulosonate cytidylyltransferase (CMP-KDO synthetase)
VVRADRLERVFVATDDERIRDAVAGFGGEAIMTSRDHLTGTDRVGEAVRRAEAGGQTIDFVLNVQGDEPLLRPADLDTMVEALESDPGLNYVTLAEPFADPEELLDPGTCKVVMDRSGNALYFSRSPVPFFRATGAAAGIAPLAESLAGRGDPLAGYRRHVGIYGFRRPALDAFAAMERGRLEEMEGLEQLRILEAGEKIRVVVSRHVTMDVDTPEDLSRVRTRLEEERLVPKEGG